MQAETRAVNPLTAAATVAAAVGAVPPAGAFPPTTDAPAASQPNHEAPVSKVELMDPLQSEQQQQLAQEHQQLQQQQLQHQHQEGQQQQQPQAVDAQATGRAAKRSPDVLADQDAMAACVTLYNVHQNKRAKPQAGVVSPGDGVVS